MDDSPSLPPCAGLDDSSDNDPFAAIRGGIEQRAQQLQQIPSLELDVPYEYPDPQSQQVEEPLYMTMRTRPVESIAEMTTMRIEDFSSALTIVRSRDPRRISMCRDSVYRYIAEDERKVDVSANMLVVRNLDPVKVTFVKESKSHREQLRNHLRDYRASLRWEDIGEDRITVTEMKMNERPSSQEDVQRWRQETQTAISDYLKAIVVRKVPFREISLAILKERDVASSVQDGYPSDVKVVLSEVPPEFVIVGNINTVSEIHGRLRGELKDIEERVYAQIQTQNYYSFKGESWKLKYLKTIRFEMLLEAKYKSIQIKIDNEKQWIEFSGSEFEPTLARNDTQELLEDVEFRVVEGISTHKLQAYVLHVFESHVRKVLAEKGIAAAFEVDKGNLRVIGKGRCLQDASTVIQEAVSITYIRNDILTSEQGEKCVDDLDEEVSGLYFIEPMRGGGKHALVCATSFKGIILSKLKELVTGTALMEGRLRLEQGLFLAMKRYCRHLIDKLTASHKVDISFKTTSSVIVIRGHKSVVDQAIKSLKELSETVAVTYVDMNRPGAVQYISSLRGDDLVKQAEDDFSCLTMQFDPDDEENCNPFKAHVTVTKGNICRQLVDVIVVPIQFHQGLELTPVSRSVVKEGGKEVKSLLEDRCGCGLKSGDVVVIPGKDIGCNSIFFCCIPKWESVENAEIFQEAIQACLECADVSNYSTISFAPLGCDQDYPPHIAARLMFDAIRTYEQTTNSGIKQIKIVTLEPDLQAFDNELSKRIVGKDTSGEETHSGQVTSRHIGAVISVIVGELWATKADVLVNSANRQLDLSAGSLSKSLVQAGGNSIQKECNKRYPAGNGPGRVLATSGGKLRCKEIYHCCIPHLEDKDALQSLSMTVERCLEMAAVAGHESIAFPALGTGLLKYPRKIVAELLDQKVSEFSKQNPVSCLRHIYIVLYHLDQESIKVFSDVFEKDPALHHIDQGDSLDFKMEGLLLRVKLGDLLKENASGIVVPTDNRISLSDELGRRLRETCGDQLVAGDSSKMKSSGWCMTKGGKLRCSTIIFLSAEYFKGDVEKMVKKCFSKADKDGMTSLCIPYIGTDTGAFVNAVVKAVDIFKSAKKLREVRIVLVDEKQLEAIVGALRKLRKHMVRQSFIHSNSQRDAGTHVYRTKSESGDIPGGCQLRILGTRYHNLQMCKDKIEAVLDDNLETRTITSTTGKLNKEHEEIIKSTCSKFGVSVIFDPGCESIALSGVKHDVTQAEVQIFEMIKQHKAMLAEAAEVQTRVQWFFVLKNDSKKRFSIVSNMNIEKAYLKGERKFSFPGLDVTFDLEKLVMDVPSQGSLRLVREPVVESTRL